ncbi:MAG: protocatechuate 3,4-dioxygenase subunit alpha [Acidimicrobiia bacterium]|nr:protocatechuate 3,4-dioxygenase subunit alpha [Acidimicrobiia bacterium]
MRLGGEGQNVVTSPDGEPIIITGRVFDGDRNPIEDALLETWQANPNGRYNHPDDTRELDLDSAFTGFARAMSNFETGTYHIETVKPGPVPDIEDSFQAPHISMVIQGRGMLNPCYTRIYFSDEEDANRDDLVLAAVPAWRRDTLVAEAVDGTNPREYIFDVRFQGDDETVFFDF